MPLGLVVQEKMLLPKVEARFSADYEKWEIITQNPDPGTLVKAGRPVMLVVISEFINVPKRVLEFVTFISVVRLVISGIITVHKPTHRVYSKNKRCP